MFWRSEKTIGLIYQFLVAALFIGGIFYFASNAQSELERLGITTGFSFLQAPSGFDIGESAIAHTAKNTYWHALVTGAANTLTVSLASIVGATMVGLLLGMARLSSNKLLSGFATAYIELFRNTPQLLQMVFWYLLLTTLPGPKQAYELVPESVFLSNRGMNFPVLENGTSLFVLFVTGVVFIFVGNWLVTRLLDKRLQQTGKTVARWPLSILAAMLACLLAWLVTGAPTELERPAMAGFKIRGGETASPEFLALFFGLTLYIGAFIGEIVRAGIQSVGRGQLEAADAIPIGRFDRFRLIVLPQALRVMVPPITAQYVSLLKNSSLGVAVGYPELFNVTNTTTTLSGQALECVIIMAIFYLSIALTISFAMNIYNAHVQIKER